MGLEKWKLTVAATGVAALAVSAHAAEEPTNEVKTALESTTISGYVSTSANWLFKGGDSSGTRLPGRSFVTSDKMDGFNLDVANLVVKKPLDESLWSAGYEVDLMLGPDSNFSKLGTTSTSSQFFSDSSDFAVKEAYVDVRAPLGENGIEFKMGVFDTIIGYEVVHSGENFHYTRSYGFALEPFQHTGVLASYEFTDTLSVALGVADSQDSVINERAAEEEDVTYMGALYLTAPEGTGFLSGSQATFGATYGDSSGTLPGSRSVRATRNGNLRQPPAVSARSVEELNFYAGGTLMTPIEGVSVGAAFDYAEWNETAATSPFGASANRDAKTIAGYLNWEATQNLGLHFRADYGDSNDGVFTGLNAAGTAYNDDELLGLTATADYSLWANVITRLEARYDKDLDDESGNEAFGTVNNPDNDAFMLGLNVIYQF